MVHSVVRASVAAAVFIQLLLTFTQHWLQGDEDVFGPMLLEDDTTTQPATAFRLNRWLDADADVASLNDEASVDLVVVAGAWRRPNGTLSTAFERRIDHGLRTAMLLGVRHVLFTGGLNDSTAAVAYANDMTDAPERLFPAAWVLELPAKWQHVARDVKAALERFPGHRLQDSFRLFETHGPSPWRWPQLHAENVSLTTFENAEQTRRWIDDHDSLLGGGDGACRRSLPLHVVVVTSPFHTKRCKILFSKALRSPPAPGAPEGTRRVPTNTGGAGSAPGPDHGGCQASRSRRLVHVHVSGAWGDMFEWLMPGETISWVDEVPPTLAQVPVMPRWFKVWSHSVYCTYHNWRTHVRMTMLSIEAYSKLRELGAVAKGVVLGQISLIDFLPTWRHY